MRKAASHPEHMYAWCPMLQDEHDYELYRKLWRLRPTDVWKPSSEGAVIAHVEYRSAGFPIGHEAGLFFVDESKRPVIWIRRPQPPEDPSQPDVARASLSELITLAHERGHEASWRADDYQPMTMPEERRAWEQAERILRELGFNEWEIFESQKKYSLEAHAQSGTPEHPPR